MMRHRSAFRHVLGVLWALSWAGHAQAYEEQASLDVSTGYVGLIESDTLPGHGVSVDIGGSWGVHDMLVVRAAGGYAPMLSSDDSGHVGRTRVELAYIVDIVRWVPFFGLGGSLWLYDDSGVTVRPAWHAVFGLDFLWNRTWIVGLDIRLGVLWEQAHAASANEGQLRISRMFDLF